MQEHVEKDGDEGEDDLLSKLGQALAGKREDAKRDRMASGIEDVWRAAEDAYVGIDDSNRHDYANARWAKPMDKNGPVTTSASPVGSDKSTIFVRVTSRYTDAGKSKLAEILLPPGDKAFSIKGTPVPDAIKKLGDKSQVVDEQYGPLTRPASPTEMQAAQGSGATSSPASPLPAAGAAPPTTQGTPGAAPAASAPPGGVPGGAAGPPLGAAAPQGAPPQGGPAAASPAAPRVPLTVDDIAREHVELADAKAKRAETRIYDWMVETNYQGEARKIIADSARLGVGVIKGPVPVIKRGIAATRSKDGGIDVTINEKVIPGTSWVDAWNFFPDGACGESIHSGEFCFERDHISEKSLLEFKTVPGYLPSRIDRVISEGPDKIKLSDEIPGPTDQVTSSGSRYEIWYYYGTVTREEIELVYQERGRKVDPDVEDKEKVNVIVTLVNDTVIKAVLNPLDTGTFPYDTMSWQRRKGHWAGIGIPEQLSAPQRIVNAATRSMLNNAGISSGGQIVIDQSAIRPADGSWKISPNKVWYQTGDSEKTSVKDAFEVYQIDNVVDEMMKIIEFGMKIAEETTSIPLVTQGQSGDTTPNTLGGMQLQNNNANQLLRDIGYSFDDQVTEPLVRRHYEWLLLDPDVPDDEKGDFQIDARGSSALVERALQAQVTAQMGTMVLDPRYELDPALWAEEFLKSNKFDPQKFKLTPQRKAELAAQAQGQQDPRIQAANIASQTALQIAGQKKDSEDKKTNVTATVDLHELMIKRELALLDYANRHQITLAQVQGDLAKTAMTLQTQERLNTADNAVDFHHKTEDRAQRLAQKPTSSMKPPVQAGGRAKNGQAFSQA